MFIKSIVLDGFKSYGTRVEITGFDPEFNAITGLNGTGKSNILDSICFVLGITNLSNVRAGSLQELIYKEGQAGVTKATVSIKFDNRDKNQCPLGYEDHDEITVTRQVVMGGKNKYLINGINVQNKRVSDLFCSIQLNVNNPHFLIMQGRITKVLNMKPPEILSMVEEAAGTRMYEAKKQAAEKTIEKKDAKLRELNEIIREDIAPMLQKLRDERSQFQEYQKVVRELDNLSRLHVAWKYVSAEECSKKAEGKVTEVQDEIKQMKDSIHNNKLQAHDLDTLIADLNHKLDKESGNVLKELESELQSLETEEAGSGAAHRAAKETLAAHERRARLLERALIDDDAALQTKKKVLDEASCTFSALRTASEEGSRALAEAQEKFLAVSTGLEGGSQSLQDQLMAAKLEVTDASTLISQIEMEKRNAEQRLKELQKEFHNSSSQFARDQESIGRHQAQCDRLKDELSDMSFSASGHAELQARTRALHDEARRVRDQADALGAALHGVNFHYTPPERNFDSNRVLGTVCRLITVKDPMFCVALETAARGSLSHVVVDTDSTSKLLLQHGKLQARTTFIPLNKITGHVIDAKTLRIAQQVGGGPDKVYLALDLVAYDAVVTPAMRYVFGSTLVCVDQETAKRVTFEPRVRRRCVTLDGDVFEPAGTLAGGARARTGTDLQKLQELKELEARLRDVEQQLAQSNAELAHVQRDAQIHQTKQQKYKMLSHELEVMKSRMENTAHAQLHAEIEALKEQIVRLDATMRDQTRVKDEAEARAKDLQAKVVDIKGHREREYKKAEEALKKAKKEAEKHSLEWRRREQEYETLRLEVAELQAAVASSRQQLDETTFHAVELHDNLATAATAHQKAQEAMKSLQIRIKQHKAEIASRSSEIVRLVQKKEQLAKNNNELELKIKELDYNIKELQNEATECDKRIKCLEKENPWISSEKQYFGAAGGLYDFEARQASLAGARLSQLQARRDKLGRGLNARAHTLLGKEEEQYQDTMQKKRIVEADREKLIQVMKKLDEKKRRILVEACERVNKDFGSIFSTLLPGAQAKLTPPAGLTVLDGLEVNVGFNSTWKESLGELSGGQRSLVALSLVLAMLRFKPAPLYILDEVDAALDLSHTQNIGQMLKEHFRDSQFIIVSLKDGMFNNANVLFRTDFVDGMSSVQRTVNSRR